MLMFGSRESIYFLRNAPDWFLDGTFDTVPPLIPPVIQCMDIIEEGTRLVFTRYGRI